MLPLRAPQDTNVPQSVYQVQLSVRQALIPIRENCRVLHVQVDTSQLLMGPPTAPSAPPVSSIDISSKYSRLS